MEIPANVRKELQHFYRLITECIVTYPSDIFDTKNIRKVKCSLMKNMFTHKQATRKSHEMKFISGKYMGQLCLLFLKHRIEIITPS